MQVFNTLFGAGMTSKLFMNVREKLSLCYSIGSSYYGSKGLVTLAAGIDAAQKELATEANARSLIAAIQADCAEGNMAQNYMYHTGSFRMEDEYAEAGYRDFPELGISISGDKYTWWVSVYPDSVNTLRWLESRGVRPVEVRSNNIAW